LTKHAKDAGADGALMITPYYNKPTQNGLYEHFKAIAEAVDIPIVMYNVPSRTSVNLLPETVARCAQIDNIVGIKEARGSMNQVSDIIRRCPDNFSVLSGDDFTCMAQVAIGGCGVISVISNVAPKDMSSMMDAALAGNFNEARKLHYKMFPLMKAMFIETNPVPAKTALELMGKIKSSTPRLPLTGMSDANITKLKTVLSDYGLI